MPKVVTATSQSILDAAAILRSGGLVGMPTETVYGLAANALDGVAVAQIFEAKGRPQFNPLIIHIFNTDEAKKYVVFSELAENIAAHFWPGPLTLILPRVTDCKISELASAGLPTLAVRVPSHKIAQELLKACKVPLAAPSANKSGGISATTPAHVAEGLGNSVDMILAAGASDVGLESTVLDLSGDAPVILRPGAITAEDIEAAVDVKVAYDFGDGTDIKSPGQLLKHYAPSIPIRLNAIDVNPGEALLAFGNEKFMGIKGGGAAKNLPEDSHRNLSEHGDLHEAAANLFAYLRALDNTAYSAIAVMNIPNVGLGIAINDRLKRAAETD